MTDSKPQRIAKVIARAGLASRRDAEKMVVEGRVTLNGKTVSNVAQTVVPRDRLAVDGKPLPQAEGARVWLYHKPVGLVVSEKDEEGRDTIFDALRPTLGRVLSVGRLDLNSEGLLLLTNDGGLKRRLELPATGWLRRYRVRVNGQPDEAGLQRLRDGIEVEDDTGAATFASMQVSLDRQQGANAWLTVGLREGRNREIRRAMAALDLYVNRLIRVSYGPFQLGTLAPGAVEEVRPRVLADQLGGLWDGDLADAKRATDQDKGGRGPTRSRRANAKGASAAAKSSEDKADLGRLGKRADTKKTKAERKAEKRADLSISLRKGGQRGRGFTKKKAPKQPKD